MPLTLTADPAELAAALIDVPSVSGDERPLADEIHQQLVDLPAHLPRYEVVRSGNSILARTTGGRQQRVVLAGHIDTVPIAGNVPSQRDGDRLAGCGATDMKSGVAMLLHLAATVENPSKEMTFIFYDCEEVEHDRNGLTRIERELPEWLRGDLALLGEPTNALVEAGCQGTMAFTVTTKGARAHAARSWMGHNAIHDAQAVLAAITSFDTREVDIDGCRYREGLNAVDIRGGVASNVIPDACVVKINYRFAPDLSPDDAVARVRAHFADFEVEIIDVAAGALPGLSQPAAAEFVTAVTAGADPAAGAVVQAKLGWTDVARFAALGIPAVNYGPGDPMLAHTPQEWVDVNQIRQMTQALRGYLS